MRFFEIKSVKEARRMRLEKEQNIQQLQTKITILKHEEQRVNKDLIEEKRMHSQRMANKLERNELRNIKMSRELKDMIRAQEVILTKNEERFRLGQTQSIMIDRLFIVKKLSKLAEGIHTARTRYSLGEMVKY